MLAAVLFAAILPYFLNLGVSSMGDANEAFYAQTGPPHWQVFYDTLDRFPTTGPIPAPAQQAAVETALLKNVLSAVSGGAAGVRPALATLQRDLEQALRRQL